MTRLLSVQSHVAFGSVGNRAVRWAMAQLALPCDAIDTVQWSNHAGYAAVGGPALDRAGFDAIWDAFEENALVAEFSHVVSGFAYDAGVIEGLADRLRSLRERGATPLFVCDPVMGDGGKTYVPDSVVHALRDQLAPLADVITPNATEASLLLERQVESIEDAHAACAEFLARGALAAIVTSVDVDDDTIACVAHHRDAGEYERRLARIPHYVVGTGDLFAALVTGWLMRPGSSGFAEALDASLNALRELILGSIRTHAAERGAQPIVELDLAGHVDVVRALRPASGQSGITPA